MASCSRQHTKLRPVPSWQLASAILGHNHWLARAPSLVGASWAVGQLAPTRIGDSHSSFGASISRAGSPLARLRRGPVVALGRACEFASLPVFGPKKRERLRAAPFPAVSAPSGIVRAANHAHNLGQPRRLSLAADCLWPQTVSGGNAHKTGSKSPQQVNCAQIAPPTTRTARDTPPTDCLGRPDVCFGFALGRRRRRAARGQQVSPIGRID